MQFQRKKRRKVTTDFFKEPLFYLCIVTLFFYLCAESQLMASMQWIMMPAGRLLVAWLSGRVAKEKLLPVMGIGLVLFFRILINSESVGMASVGVVIAVDLMCIFVLVSYVKKGNKS